MVENDKVAANQGPFNWASATVNSTADYGRHRVNSYNTTF